MTTACTSSARNDLITSIFKTLEYMKLKPSDEDFVTSINHYFLRKGFLTDKQYAILLDIYERN